jgi:hypothetical protein
MIEEPLPDLVCLHCPASSCHWHAQPSSSLFRGAIRSHYSTGPVTRPEHSPNRTAVTCQSAVDSTLDKSQSHRPSRVVPVEADEDSLRAATFGPPILSRQSLLDELALTYCHTKSAGER